MKECPDYFNEEQREIFQSLINGIEGLIDTDYELLCNTAYAIEKVRYFNRKLNTEKQLMGDRTFMASRSKFIAEVENNLKALDITPQARNKAKAETVKVSDPLVDLLGDVL